MNNKIIDNMFRDIDNDVIVEELSLEEIEEIERVLEMMVE